MSFTALAKKATPDTHSSPHHKTRPNHFPSTPFLNTPKPPAISPPQHVPARSSSRMTTESATSKQSTWKKDPFERRLNTQTQAPAPAQPQAATSIYEAFSRANVDMDTRITRPEPVVEIDDTSNRRPRTADLLSPVNSDRHRGVSRSSSLDGLSNTGSIYSPNSTMTDLTDLGELSLRFPRAPHEGGYESSSSAHRGGRRHRSNVRAQMMSAEVLEEHADEDKVSAHHLNTVRARNKSVNSVASKIKADKMLGLDAPDTSLVSAYFCSGLGLLPEAWSLADSDAIRSIRPSDDSMGVFWRPELLHNAFAGDAMADLFVAGQNASGRPVIVETHPKSLDPANRFIPGAGLQASKLVAAKCIKAAHPKDVEVINSPTCPPSTCHTFSFTLPRQDTLAAIARTRVNNGTKLPPGVNATQAAYQSGFMDSQVGLDPRGFHGSAKPEPNFKPTAEAKGPRDPTDIRYYGVTVLTWYHADEKRHEVLERIHNKLGPEGDPGRPASMRSVRSADISLSLLAASADKPKRRRLKMPWGTSRTPSEAGQADTVSEADTHFTDYEPDKRSPLARLGIRASKNPPKAKQFAQLQQEEYSPKLMASGGVFWIPVAHTLVSRHPIYDTMLDFLRLDIGQFARDAYWHNVNVLRLLNTATPRPGELYRLRVGTARDDDIALEAYMPGAVDFEKGIVKVDYQLWPLFQAVDFDHLLVCIDVAMSQTGRIIMTSKYTYMLSVAVNTLKYILDLRGWEGIAIPIVHARDTPLIVEDPGPYIIGLPSEFKALVTVPPEVVFVDLDTSSLVCKKMPAFVNSKARRDKAKAKLTAVFGPEYTEVDRNVPIDFKVSNPMGCFQHLNRLQFPGGRKPKYVGQAMAPPPWWRQTEIMTAFDKIMADKHKKPSLIQRLTRTGVNRAEAQLSVGEQVAKVMMRRRALHYVESRDQLEIKVAKVNARLAAIAVDGRFWRAEFQKFESYATQLAVHTERLRVMVDREKQDTKRYSSLAAEQTKARTDLESKLQATEDARAEAMRQLSDMHHSIQELEREREQIMDVFEDQLNIALETIPEAIPQSPSQSTGILSPPRSPVAYKAATSRSRPTTRDSEMSTLSRLTTIKPPSMMGSTRSGMPPLHGGSTSILSGEGFDNRAFERSDYVSHRIAAIQAKLEIALQSSTARSVSVPTGLETVEDEDDEGDETTEDRMVPTTLPKRAASALAHTGESPAQSMAAHTPGRPEIPSPMRAACRKRPSSVQIQSSNFNSNSVGNTTFGADGTDRAGALARLMGNPLPAGQASSQEQGNANDTLASSGNDSLSRRGSLMKPGVSYKIRPKRYSMTSTNGRQSAASGSATSDHFPDMDSVPRLHKHEKTATNSTDGGGVLTPSTSMIDQLHQTDKESVVHINAEFEGDDGSLGTKDYSKDDDRRLSAISTATVTFGQ